MKFYLVSTPIGNMEDITLRALKVLQSADIVVCEDSRRTGLLLQRVNALANRVEAGDLRQKIVVIHEHSRDEKISRLLKEVKAGRQAALVTDAGTPGVADPGGRVVERALAAGVEVAPIPGPSSLTAILTLTGWRNEPVLFVGYLPKKKGRQTFLSRLKEDGGRRKLFRTLVLFEAPSRINRTVEELSDYLGEERRAVLGRELTKKFEDILRGTLSELAQKELSAKGEYTIAIELGQG